MAEGTPALDLALTTEGDADGSNQIEYLVGTGEHEAEGPLQYIPTHDEIASRKLAPPFWGKPFVQAVLSAFVREIQTLEDTIWEFMDLRTLPLADLPRLKVLGKIVGQPRLGFDTEDYRLLIQARARANVSRGLGSDLFAVLELMLGPGEYTMLEMGNATLYVSALQPVTDVGVAMVEQILPDTRAAGVGLHFLFTDDPDIALWGTALWGDDDWASVRIL
jgi:hypothetical protein